MQIWYSMWKLPENQILIQYMHLRDAGTKPKHVVIQRLIFLATTGMDLHNKRSVDRKKRRKKSAEDGIWSSYLN